MNIKIDLEDNKLCKGCPAHLGHEAKCLLGHTRTHGLIRETKDHYGKPYVYIEPARPITCFLQSDSLEQIPETNEKPITKPIGQAIALPYTPPEVPTPNASDILP